MGIESSEKQNQSTNKQTKIPRSSVVSSIKSKDWRCNAKNFSQKTWPFLKENDNWAKFIQFIVSKTCQFIYWSVCSIVFSEEIMKSMKWPCFTFSFIWLWIGFIQVSHYVIQCYFMSQMKFQTKEWKRTIFVVHGKTWKCVVFLN